MTLTKRSSGKAEFTSAMRHLVSIFRQSRTRDNAKWCFNCSEPDSEGYTKYEVTLSYNKDRRRFVISTTTCEIESRDGYSVFKATLDWSNKIYESVGSPVARFSASKFAKVAEAINAEALEFCDKLYTGDLSVLSKLNNI